MKSYREEMWFDVPDRRALINITPRVESALHKSGIKEGLALVNAMHITASVFINDDDGGLHQDYERWLERLATVINKKNVPKNWSDNDLADYKQKILTLASEIKRLEIISSQSDGKVPDIKVDGELKSVIDKINSFSTLQKLFLMNVLKKDVA